MANKVTKAESDADLASVADELGHPPSISEYQTYGNYSIPTVARHYDGSFKQARAAVCGGPAKRQAQHRRDDLLADIRRVADIVGGEPSKDDYHEYGNYPLSTITYRFESWVAAKKEASVYDGGVGVHRMITDDDLLDDLRRVDDTVDGPVTQLNYRKYGNYSTPLIQRRFGGWEAGCQKAGVARPYMGPKQEPDEAVLGNLQDVSEKLGHTPSKSEYDELGDYTYGIIQTRFGTITNACLQAGLDPRPEGGQPGELNANWKGGYEPYYGPNWPEQRRKTLQRDSHTCQICAMGQEKHNEVYDEEHSVHHIKPFRTFASYLKANRLSNLITLCRGCHGEIDEEDSTMREKLKKLVNRD